MSYPENGFLQPSKQIRRTLLSWSMGILVAGVGLLLSPSNQLAWILVLIALLGIPHGATDYWIYRLTLGERKGTLLRFLSLYLGIMACYALLWWAAPAGALGLFLLLSAYHFGQSNWQFAFPGQNRFAPFLFLLWGGWVIAAPVLWHFETETKAILEVLLRHPLSGEPLRLLQYIPGLLLLGNLGVAGLLWGFGKIGGKRALLEMGQLLLLSVLFYRMPVLLGFTAYFVCWHSWGSMQDQIHFFRTQRLGEGWRSFLQKALPYSLAAWVGLAGIWWGFVGALEPASLSAYGFIFIALVTLPHMILIDRLFDKLRKPPNKAHAELIS